MLVNAFAVVLNMSITASVAAVLIIFFRWIFGKRLPKIFNYALWSIVLLRLLIPFSLPSMFSVFNAIPVPETIRTQSSQYYETGNNISYSTDYGSISQEKTDSDVLNNGINRPFSAATAEASVDPIQVLIFAISWIWLTGAAGLFSFSIFVYFRALHRLKEASLYKNDDLISACIRKLRMSRKVQIYTSDRVHTPVVCGLIKARIILPLDLAQGCNEAELKHIITHELVHIKRFDYILKPLYVLALCVHWFNPVIWIGFILSQKDMEMACDEKVVSVFDNDIRSEYAASLIKLATKQNVLLNGGLMAFGESNIKSRVKGIMGFRKSGLWLGAAAIVILVAIGVVLLTNGQHKQVDKQDIIAVEDHKKLETSISEYYLRVDPNNEGILKIYNIKKYGSGYLVLTEKYRGEGESHTILFLIDNGYSTKATASGHMPISPCFSANIVRDQGKSIIYGNFKNRKWDPKTGLVSDVQIDNIKIAFEDGTEIKEPVSMDKGYIVVVDTLSKIKNIEVYNSKGELQSDLLNESYCSEYVFKTVENSTGTHVDESKLLPYWLETVVINDCTTKDGPGDHYNNIGSLKYGDIVIIYAKDNEWVKCMVNNCWFKSTNLIDEQQHKKYNLGIITAKEVTVGSITLNKGNLVQVLKRDENRSCVTIRVIDVNGGKTGWIDNKDYTMAKPGVFFNQAYLKKGTILYKEPSLKAQIIECSGAKEGTLFVGIRNEQNGWMEIGSPGGIHGWVQKENVYIPMPH